MLRIYIFFINMYLSFMLFLFFFFNDTATTEIYTLSLHDALPIYARVRHHLRDEAAEGMADDGRFPLELADGVDIVLRHLLDALVGEDLRIAIGRLDGLRVIGPHRRERCVALLFKQRTPAVPTAGEEPEAVDEHDRLQSRGVGAVDFLLFMVREICHVILLWVCRLGQSVRFSRSMYLAKTLVI